MATNRMHRGLVAISASAVAAIYMAGYVRTQSADASIGALSSGVAASAPLATEPPRAAATTAIPQIIQRAVPAIPTSSAVQPTSPPATAAPQPAAAQQSQGSLKDGTFIGQGSSRRGDVWVSVDVQGGRIADVTITRSTLQYPLRDIAGLPSQVVQRQTAQVDTVSRATYSSQAFKQAVSQALSKAA
jgi:uncharacterized protein with FMN-binding domain